MRQRGRSIVSIDALAQSSRRSTLTTKNVIVASSSYNVPAGGVAALQMIANATGKQLLTRFYRLPAQLVLPAGAGHGRTITFAYPRVVAVSTGNWHWTLTPCAPCVTLVTLLTVTHLPTAGQLVIFCHGSGCPFARQLLRPRRPELVLTRMFAHSRLVQGTQLKLLITARNQVAEVITYTMRTGTSPSATLRCLAPGQRRPSVCHPAG